MKQLEDQGDEGVRQRYVRGLAKELDVGATLARIERELPPAPYRVKEGISASPHKWTEARPARR